MDTYRSVCSCYSVILVNECFRWMFDCCRVPGTSGLDWAISYAKEGENGNAGHVVVFRKNRAWKVEIAKDAHILSTGDLERFVGSVCSYIN